MQDRERAWYRVCKLYRTHMVRNVFWVVYKVSQNNINQFIAEWNNICIFAIVIWKMSYLWCMNGDKSTDKCHPYITNISCSNGAPPCQVEFFHVPSLFHKVIFSIEKHLYDVLNKSAKNLEMCEICVNTHSYRRSSRANLFIFTKICKGENSFFGSFLPFSVFVCLFYPPSNWMTYECRIDL